jgi:hypothetical protein
VARVGKYRRNCESDQGKCGHLRRDISMIKYRDKLELNGCID